MQKSSLLIAFGFVFGCTLLITMRAAVPQQPPLPFLELLKRSQASRGDVNDLLTNVISEREKFLQYSVECTVTGPVGNLSTFRKGWSTDAQSKTKGFYEYSRIDQHYVTAVRDLGETPEVWRILGVSGDSGFIGLDGNLKIVDASRNFLARDPEQTKLRLFDPLAVGLVFCSDFFNGNSIETQLGYLLQDSQTKGLSTLEKKDKKVEWRKDITTRMIFDSKHSYWPLSLKWTNGEIDGVEWEIELGRFNEYDVPKVASLLTAALGKFLCVSKVRWVRLVG
jgi:hypothetical protein